MRLRPASAAIVFGLLSATHAHAQTSAAALELYEQGRTALAAGDLETACSRFRASDQLEAGAGARAHLGDCEERRGRIASAWEAYRSALKKLPAGDARIAKVQARVDALAPRLPRLQVVLGMGAPPDTIASEAGVVIGSASTSGIPLPFDPGTHRLTVTASGRAPWVVAVVLAEGETRRLIVEPGPAVGPFRSLPAPLRPLPGAGGHSVGPWVVGGVGVASLVASAALGGIVLHAHAINEAGCNPFQNTCTQAAKDAAKVGAWSGPATTVTLIAGVAGVAGGALWLGIRDSAPARPRVGIGVGSLRLEGSW